MTKRILVVTAVLWSGVAQADIWVREDAEGVLHFTNISPAGGGWRKVYKTGPGKAQTISGATRVAGCKESRNDVVPATDRSPDRYSRYDRDIRDAAALYQMPEAFIRAIIKVESDYDPKVVSCAGARGLMQIMPSVEKDMGIDDVWNPRQNIMGGTRMLRTLANKFGGDLTLTIAGFHAGAGAVLKYHGVPPYDTTHLYLQMVKKQYDKFKTRYGTAPPPIAEAGPQVKTP